MHTNDAARMARTLMNDHGLFHWTFQFDRSVKRFGVCKYGSRTISLSENLTRLNDESKVRDTILHEIAHALTPGHGHDYVWQAKCREIGAKPARCYSATDTVVVKLPIVMTCQKCQKTLSGGRARMPKQGLVFSHKGCGGRISFHRLGA